MTQEEAAQILDRSIKELQEYKSNKRHRVYISDVETEVIHVACLAILQDRAYSKAQEYALIFTQAAMNQVSLYTEKEATDGIRDIQKNVQWNELWRQLKEYFQEIHDRNIGEQDFY